MKHFFSKSKFFLCSRKGFSLIELSVVISVTASAAVGFLAWTQPPASTNALKSTATITKMKEIQKAIDSFRAQKKRLPCPADPLMRNDTTRTSIGTDYNTPTGTSQDYYVNNFGMEDLDITQTAVNGTTTLGVDCPVSVGALPVFSLDLDESYINDAWGRRFTYHVANTICGADAGTDTLSNTESEAIGCNDISYQNNSGNLTVTGANTTNAAYVVVSHGANGKGAFLPSGAKLPNGTGNELENSNGDATYVKASQSSTFDDLLIVETKNQIESAINRKNIRNISVADCEENSQALKNVTLTETTFMKTGGLNAQNYQRLNNTYTLSNTGDKGLLSIMKTTQSICVSYYGATAATINGKTWSGAQCPGNNDSTANGSTYIAATDSCVCYSGLWNGNCMTTSADPIIWLDASDSTTTLTSSACTGGSASNAGTVGCWKSKVGSTHAIQSATLNQPTLRTSVINGKSVIRFDGANDVMPVPNLNMPTSTYNIFLVDMHNTASRSVSLVLHDGTFPNSIVNILQMDSATNRGYYHTYSGGNTSTNWAWPARNAFSITNLYLSNNTSMKLYRNGFDFNNNILPGPGNPAAMTNLRVGSSGGAAYPYPYIDGAFNGDIAEVIIYSRSMSNTERQSTESYLGTKYNITLGAP